MTNFLIYSNVLQDIDQLQAEVSEIEDGVDVLEPEVQQLQTQVSQIQTDISQIQSEIALSALMGNITGSPFTPPTIVDVPTVADVASGSLNKLCAGRYIVVINGSGGAILCGQVLSWATKEGRVRPVIHASGESDPGSQAVGVALNAAASGAQLNMAVSGFCTTLAETDVLTATSEAGKIVISGTADGTSKVATGAISSNVATVGSLLIQADGAGTSAGKNILLRIAIGYENY